MIFCTGPPTAEIYTYLLTLTLHDALPSFEAARDLRRHRGRGARLLGRFDSVVFRIARREVRQHRQQAEHSFAHLAAVDDHVDRAFFKQEFRALETFPGRTSTRLNSRH